MDFLELANFGITEEERSTSQEVWKQASIHHKKQPRSHLVDFNGNIKQSSHPPAQTSLRRAPPGTHYAPYTTQGNFTPTPHSAPFHQTAEHDSDVPEDSIECGSTRDQETGDENERAGINEERVVRSHDTDSSSSSRNHGDKVAVMIHL